MRPLTLRLLLFLSIGVVCYFDVITGPDIGLSLFYLIPIAIAAWFIDRPTALTCAAAASAAWIYAELAWRPENLFATLWNGFTRVAIYTSLAWLVSRVKRDQIELQKVVDSERRLARTDITTSLANPRAFVEILDGTANTILASGQPLSLVFIDLDNFKSVNDAYGHAAGDGVLASVGAVIRGAIRSSDVAARLGGDEFALLLPAATVHQAEAIANRVIDGIGELARSYDRARLGASAGVVFCAERSCDVTELMKTADTAMYEAKEQGKNRVVVREYDARAAKAVPTTPQEPLPRPR